MAFNFAAPQQPAERQSQYWINVGYPVESGTNLDFVSLGLGIPLDSIKELPLKGNSPEFLQFTAARNELREKILAKAKELKPGEATIIGGGETGLQIQLRHVSGEKTAPKGSNPFSLNFEL